jgi:hypothetical protein
MELPSQICPSVCGHRDTACGPANISDIALYSFRNSLGMGEIKLGGRDSCNFFQLLHNGSLSSFGPLQLYDDDVVQIGEAQLGLSASGRRLQSSSCSFGIIQTPLKSYEDESRMQAVHLGLLKRG